LKVVQFLRLPGPEAGVHSNAQLIDQNEFLPGCLVKGRRPACR